MAEPTGEDDTAKIPGSCGTGPFATGWSEVRFLPTSQGTTRAGLRPRECTAPLLGVVPQEPRCEHCRS